MQVVFSWLTAALAGIESSRPGIKSLFVFGDSYTDTGFRGDSPYPTLAQPFGYPLLGKNPDDRYLDGPGVSANTSANGPVWPQHLTMHFNHTPTLTYNFAIGGASIPDGFADQILNNYEPRFSSLFSASHPNARLPSGAFTWNSRTSIFFSWIGINDINWCSIFFNSGDFTACLPDRMHQYASLLDNLYNTGARNFLLLNMPPLDRAPMIINHGPEYVSNYADGVKLFNHRYLPALLKNFSATHEGVKVGMYDTHAFFTPILDNPHAYGFRDATCYPCEGCKNDTGCVWANEFHPQTAVHERLARDMVEELQRLGWDG